MTDPIYNKNLSSTPKAAQPKIASDGKIEGRKNDDYLFVIAFLQSPSAIDDLPTQSEICHTFH